MWKLGRIPMSLASIMKWIMRGTVRSIESRTITRSVSHVDMSVAKKAEIYERRTRARTSSTDSFMPEVTVVSKPNNGSILGNLSTAINMVPSRRSLTFLQIVLLNAVVCGVEICACAGFTYIPPMLLKAGYTEENMSIILGLGPLLGFFLVPIIGRASDRCKSRYGRRKPFILVISVALICSLIVIPYADYFCSWIFGASAFSKSITLICLTVGVVMLDFTSQACLTPCEALLSDASKDTDQHERVFTVYSLMISVGGFIGYLITALDWHANFIGIYFGSQERSVFTMLMILFAILLSATLMVAEEKPLLRSGIPGDSSDLPLVIGNGRIESGYDTNSNSSEEGIPAPKLQQSLQNLKNSSSAPSRTRLNPVLSKINLNNLLKCKCVSVLSSIFRYCVAVLYSKLPESAKRMFDIPFVLRHLALANFCSWTAVMGFNLFFTDFVGNAVYQGNPNAPEDSELRNRFDEGVRMGSWGLLLHCITSAVYAFFVERLVDKYGCRLTYLVGMLTFTFAMLGMVLVPNVHFVIFMAGLTGFAYATLTTIPFILVSKYHSNKEVYFFDVIPPGDTGNANVLQGASRGIATDMGTLDSFYFLSQVVLSAMMGYIVHITGTVLSYMVTAGVMGMLSCIFIQKIIVNKQEIFQIKQSQVVVNL